MGWANASGLLQTVCVSVLDSLRVGDHVLSIFAAMNPLRADWRLTPSPGNIEHVGRRREPGETGAHEPHQFLPPSDRHSPVRRAGGKIAVMQIIGLRSRF